MLGVPRSRAGKFIAGIFLGVGTAFGALAGELPDPEGPVVLTVSGNISATNGDGVALFDLEMLRELETRSFTTETIWTDGPQTFEGASLDDFLLKIGVEEGQLTATAVNDYEIDIPVSDAVSDGPIIAYAVNGKAMTLRDKGPLWIVYPYDAKPEYRSEVIYARSIWQLDRIAVDR